MNTGLAVPSRFGLPIRVLVGVAAGILTLAIAHRASQASSRWALAHSLVETHGSWLLPRFIAWAAVSIAVGCLIGLAFRRRAVLPAAVAAITAVIVHVSNFLYLYGYDAFLLLQIFWLEWLVVLAFIPASAFLVSKRHGA